MLHIILFKTFYKLLRMRKKGNTLHYIHIIPKLTMNVKTIERDTKYYFRMLKWRKGLPVTIPCVLSTDL